MFWKSEPFVDGCDHDGGLVATARLSYLVATALPTSFSRNRARINTESPCSMRQGLWCTPISAMRISFGNFPIPSYPSKASNTTPHQPGTRDAQVPPPTNKRSMSQVWRGIMTEAFGKSHTSRSQASLLRRICDAGRSMTGSTSSRINPSPSGCSAFWGEGGTPMHLHLRRALSRGDRGCRHARCGGWR